MENKGFTLIELIASIALFGIVAAAIAGLYTTSLRMGQNVTALSDISDNESLAIERVERLIINSETMPSFSDKTLVTSSGENEYLVSFDSESRKLYLTIRKKGETSADDPEPLADNVTAFDVSFDDYETNGTVRLTAAFSEAKRTETITRTIYLRNRY